MGKTLEQKLKSASLTICGLKAQISELEDIIQAHKTVQKWRETEHLPIGVAEHIAATTMRHSGSEENKSASPGLAGGYRPDLIIIDDMWEEPELGQTMAEAHRVWDTHALFDKVMQNRIHPSNVMDDYFTDRAGIHLSGELGVPSEFIGVDMADSIIQDIIDPEADWGVGQAPCEFVPEDVQAILFVYLEGLDPNCTTAVWMETAHKIAEAYRHNVIGGIEILHDWSKGSLGHYTLPVTYSEQTTNCVWAEILKTKGANHE